MFVAHKRIWTAVGVVVVVGTTVLAFQNCTPMELEQAQLASKNTNDSLGDASDPLGDLLGDSGGANGTGNPVIPTTTALKVTAATNDQAKMDCSKTGSIMNVTVSSTDPNLMGCIEFELNVPSTAKRYGEKAYCNSASSWYTLKSTPAWTLTAGGWIATNGGWAIANSAIVPGSYVQLIKDSAGNVARGDAMVVGRAGGDTCNTGSPLVSNPRTKTCSWSAFVVGGTVGPTAPCSTANVGQQLLYNGTNYTCVCN